jgi:hypothetical protein
MMLSKTLDLHSRLGTEYRLLRFIADVHYFREFLLLPTSANASRGSASCRYYYGY